MKSFLIAGFLLASAVCASAQPFDIILHFGDTPEVVDRTPKPNGAVNGRFYAPGHPGGNQFRIPLSEFEISVLDPAVAPGGSQPVRGLSLVRSRTTSCCVGLMLPPQHGGEAFWVLLTTTNSEALASWKGAGSPPETFPVGADSKLSYDFSDPAFIPGGGLFGGGPGGWDTTVRAYDVKIVSFELVPGAPPVAPPLVLIPNGEFPFLAWADRWSTFIAEEAETVAGPWRPLSVQPKSIDDFVRVIPPVTAPRFFRIRPRTGPY